jgi:hypothetical protein
MLDMTRTTASPVFNYKALRLMMGVIALSLPYVVIWISTDAPSSISASYFTEGRDVFTGMLFVIGAFLFAYNGHTFLQAIASKFASIAAILVALFPTSCDGCAGNIASGTHLGAATTLFMILAYFCLGPFRQNTKKQPGTKGRRALIYLVCGWLMIFALLIAAAGNFYLSAGTLGEYRVIYWVELIALNAFGIAWITAGKAIPGLVDRKDALFSFGRP